MDERAIAILFTLFLVTGCTIEKKHETIHTDSETTTTETIDIKRGKF
jgi:hypothetical protein